MSDTDRGNADLAGIAHMNTDMTPAIQAAIDAEAKRVQEANMGCDHDWRVDPGVIFSTCPPKQRLVCAICNEESARVAPNETLSPSRDPRDWPKADHDWP